MINLIKEILKFNGDLKGNGEKTRVLLIALFAAMLPFDMFYTTFLFYLIALLMLIDFNLPKIKSIPRQIWLFVFIYLLSAIGYTYSTDLWRAGYVLERQLAIIIFPILIPLSINCSKKNILFILTVFALSCSITIGILLFHAISTLSVFELPIKYLFTSSFFNLNFTKPIGIHPTYLSLYVSLAIIFLIDRIRAEKRATQVVIIILLSLLFIGLFFLASRTSIISTAIILLIIFPLYHIQNKGRYFMISGALIIGLIIVASQSTYIKSRFTSEFSADLTHNQLHYVSTDPDSRIMRWACAWELIKQRPIFGYGTGDEISLMMKQYLKYNMMLSYKEEFNTHNQFIAILLKNGLVGLIAFVGMLLYFFRIAIQSKNFLYLSFLLILSIGFITENIVDANKGIFFFALFNTLLGYEILLNKNKNSESKEI
jgi:O-antigen ligase